MQNVNEEKDPSNDAGQVSASRSGQASDANENECGFCFQSEQGEHGIIQREWSKDFEQYIAVCRKHRLDRCAYPDRCLMVGDHLNSECYTVEDAEAQNG